MKSSYLILGCLTGASLFLVPVSRANAADPSASDKSFVMKAAQGGMTEVEAGKAAQEKGSSQEVKDFGAMMVKDHTQNDADLMALAKTKSIEVPSALDSKHQTMVDKMGTMSGAAFDKAYINGQIKGHKQMLALMKKEESSSDADLKDFATKTADAVQMHLSKAEELKKGMK